MTEKLEIPREESLDIKTIFGKLSENGKELFLGMSHFAPEIGGTKEAVLATCAMKEDRFQKAAEELKQAGLLFQGTLEIVRPEIKVRSTTKEHLAKQLKEYQERGLINQKEVENVRISFKVYFKGLHVGQRCDFRINIRAKRQFQEKPGGNRYNLKRHEEIQKFLEESGITSKRRKPKLF